MRARDPWVRTARMPREAVSLAKRWRSLIGVVQRLEPGTVEDVEGARTELAELDPDGRYGYQKWALDQANAALYSGGCDATTSPTLGRLSAVPEAAQGETVVGRYVWPGRVTDRDEKYRVLQGAHVRGTVVQTRGWSTRGTVVVLAESPPELAGQRVRVRGDRRVEPIVEGVGHALDALHVSAKLFRELAEFADYAQKKMGERGVGQFESPHDLARFIKAAKEEWGARPREERVKMPVVYDDGAGNRVVRFDSHDAAHLHAGSKEWCWTWWGTSRNYWNTYQSGGNDLYEVWVEGDRESPYGVAVRAGKIVEVKNKNNEPTSRQLHPNTEDVAAVMRDGGIELADVAPDEWGDVEDWEEWENAGFAPAEAQFWANHGYDYGEARGWRNITTDPAVAEAWNADVADPEEARAWIELGFLQPTVHELKNSDFFQDPSDVREFAEWWGQLRSVRREEELLELMMTTGSAAGRVRLRELNTEVGRQRKYLDPTLVDSLGILADVQKADGELVAGMFEAYDLTRAWKLIEAQPVEDQREAGRWLAQLAGGARPLQEVQEWMASGLDDPRWAASGVEVDEALKWQRAGWTAWTAAPFIAWAESPEAAEEWQRTGMTESQMRSWATNGFTPAEAMVWKQSWSAEAAKRQRDRGYSHTDEVAWDPKIDRYRTLRSEFELTYEQAKAEWAALVAQVGPVREDDMRSWGWANLPFDQLVRTLQFIRQGWVQRELADAALKDGGHLVPAGNFADHLEAVWRAASRTGLNVDQMRWWVLAPGSPEEKADAIKRGTDVAEWRASRTGGVSGLQGLVRAARLLAAQVKGE